MNMSKTRGNASRSMPMPVSCALARTDAVPVALRLEPDAPLGRRELDRVRQEIREDLLEPDRVAGDPDRLGRQRRLQRDLAGLELRPACLRRPLEELDDVDRLTDDADLLLRHARHVEQIVDEADEVVDLPFQHRADGAGIAAAVAGQAQHAQAVADRGQRIAQLVRQHRQELVLVAVRLDEGRGPLLELLDEAGLLGRHLLELPVLRLLDLAAKDAAIDGRQRIAWRSSVLPSPLTR